MPTSSRRNVALAECSTGRRASGPPLEPPLHPTELDLIRSVRSSQIKHAFLALAGFLIALGIGVGATLAWQSYGDAARRTIAQLSPQLDWLAPPAPPIAPPEPAALLAASPDQLGAISRSLALLRQNVDKLAADIAKLQAGRQEPASPDIRASRTSAPAPPAAGVQGRKPAAPIMSQATRQ
jgi:hypothetical protein